MHVETILSSKPSVSDFALSAHHAVRAVRQQRPLSGFAGNAAARTDIEVDREYILELKAIVNLVPANFYQVQNYLALARANHGLSLYGMLINFVKGGRELQIAFVNDPRNSIPRNLLPVLTADAVRDVPQSEQSLAVMLQAHPNPDQRVFVYEKKCNKLLVRRSGMLVHVNDQLRVLDLESGQDFGSLCQWGTAFNDDRLVSIKKFVFFNGVSIHDWELKQKSKQCGQSSQNPIVLP